MLWRRKTPSFITHVKKKKAKCVLKYWIMSFYCVFTVCVIAWNVRQADEGTDWNLLAPLFDPL